MTEVEDFLEHFGVKGMKWGVRREQKRLAKADAKWQKNIYTTSGAIRVHNAAANRANNGGLSSLNNRPEFKGKRKLDDNGQPVGDLGKKYLREYEKLNEKWTREAVEEVHGTSPSGNFKATLDTSGGQWKIVVSNIEVKHAVEQLPDIVMEVDHDSLGQITSQRMVEDDSLEQSIDLGGEFLEHYGVKGMKWGVRKKRTKKEEKIRSSRKKTLDKRRQLSDQDIEKFVKRLENEKKLKTLIEEDLTPGRALAKKIATQGGQTAATAVVTGAGMYAVRSLLQRKFDPKEAADYLKPKKK